MLFSKFCEPPIIENGDFSRRKLSVIRGILISDNEEKACFQDLEACSDYSLSAKVRSSKFKKDFKVIVKRGYDISLFEEVLNLLREEKPLPEKYSDHALKGDYIGHRECHITPDWLLIYKKENDMITLSLTRTGSHSDLF